MTREQDEAYATTLIQLAQTDAESAAAGGEFDPSTSANRRALALWMAQELQRESDRLNLSEQTAGRMRDTASAIRGRLARALRRA